MRVGVYQNYPLFGQVDKNVEHVIQGLDGVEADLIVLPELFNTGYQFVSKEEVAGLAEEIPNGPTCQALMDLSCSRRMFLVFGMAEREGTRFYNSAIVAGPDGFMGKYRKTHLFAEEKEFFKPGDSGFEVFDIGKALIGVMICFDWLFPESARILALLGADLICHPANLVLPHCQEAMITRSLENGVFSATANRVGTESRGGKAPLTYTGRSQILDNKGTILTRMGERETGVSVVQIEVGKARDKKITPYNDRLADRRPGLYEILLKSH
ncbi:MAG: nitrilase-related carbon-nitrogen hydrolase [Pseudomonadota bacterium]